MSEEEAPVSTFTMRLDTEVKKKVEARAKKNGRSLTKEIETILRDVVEGKEPKA